MMKKSVISSVIIILLLIIGTNKSYSEGRWGVVGGVDFSTLKFNQKLFNVDYSVGYTLGAVGDLNLGPNGFGVDLSLLYTQRGATLHLGERPIWELDGYGKERSYLHYIEVPVHLRYMYIKMNGFENTLAPFVFAGPSFSILAANSRINALEYARVAVSLQFGIGVQLKNHYQIAGMYDLGITYAEKTKALLDVAARNRCWKVTFTYYFNYR
ncbi:MAG: PorT family protein [Muribaculaceae bacterium]|nr:PorT family protein [Muribaculaceae bacterium]